MGIEPTKPLLAQSFIGFEDRGRHQSGTRFHRSSYTETPFAATAAWGDQANRRPTTSATGEPGGLGSALTSTNR
jgi:hypothetical protein